MHTHNTHLLPLSHTHTHLIPSSEQDIGSPLIGWVFFVVMISLGTHTQMSHCYWFHYIEMLACYFPRISTPKILKILKFNLLISWNKFCQKSIRYSQQFEVVCPVECLRRDKFSKSALQSFHAVNLLASWLLRIPSVIQHYEFVRRVNVKCLRHDTGKKPRPG